jgi:transaldolase
LIYKAALLPQYENLVQNAIDYAAGHSGTFEEKLDLAMDKLAVNFGAEITKIVPGYVSTEVDARLSFDTQATLTRARRIINMYQEVGIDKSRILIKVAPPSVLTVTLSPSDRLHLRGHQSW